MAKPPAPDGLRHADRRRILLRGQSLSDLPPELTLDLTRGAGAPGDLIADLPVNSFSAAGRPINTSTIKVLRRPVESTQ